MSYLSYLYGGYLTMILGGSAYNKNVRVPLLCCGLIGVAIPAGKLICYKSPEWNELTPSKGMWIHPELQQYLLEQTFVCTSMGLSLWVVLSHYKYI